MTVADRSEDRPRLTERDFDSMSRNELWQAYQQLESYLHDVDEKEEAMKKQLTEAQRRENVLVLRLSAREQELQDVAAVALNYKKLQAQTPTLRKTMIDPAINYMYQKMRTELKETKEKLDLAQSELAACKFTPDSQTGKKLMSRCRTLIQENQELGSQLSTGETKQLETRIAQQDKKIAELTKEQQESEKFVLSLDDETEGLQAQIMTLKSKLAHANKRVEKMETELRGDKDEPKKEDGTQTHYFTPEQLKDYYQNLINTGYMTEEQAKVALEQAESQINEDGKVPVTFAATAETKSEIFKIWGYLSNGLGRVWGLIPGSRNVSPKKARKRRHSDSRDEENNEEELPAKKSKMLSTSNYIFNNLFENGEDSDILVHFHDQSWKLHKFYLKQSQYFDALLSRWTGNGKEITELNLEIPDENVDPDALHHALGSLYCDEIEIEPSRAVNILAAATFLQHQGLCDHLNNEMKANLGSKTVISYHDAAQMYGLPELESACIKWLEYNLMLENSPDPNLDMLRGIEPDLMAKIVGSPHLTVIQVEADLYHLLKKWLILQLDPKATSVRDTNERLKKFRKEGSSASLLSQLSPEYQAPFQKLRYSHIFTDFKGATTVENENIIPKAWISDEYRSQFLRMLRIESASDEGPSSLVCDRLQEFEKINSGSSPPESTLYSLLQSSMRCGRVLDRSKDFCWRWTGYNYGFDLVMQYNHKRRSLHISRNCSKQEVNTSVSMKRLRSLICKIRVFAKREDESMELSYNSGWKYYQLAPDQEQMVYYDWFKGCLSKSPPKLFLTVNFILADSVEAVNYLPRSLQISKFKSDPKNTDSLQKPSITADLHGNSSV
ncbi:unnamed protein product [Oikopleura dioica]|uniref:Pre-mRNA-splicing regulator WTAP n=1 Tax=Oikopleura dioica TaxID=34765 RepID=E4WUT3_OIKDI|nr:unnamed protein product [Oikopleura dioica]